jgi:hypothetical protein
VKRGIDAAGAQLAGGAVDRWADAVAPLGGAALGLWSVLVAAVLGVFALTRGTRAAKAGTWDCGYAAPTPRMQYTGHAFAQMATELLPGFLRPRSSIPKTRGTFPERAALASRTDDPWTRAVYEPALAAAADRFARLRWLQQGSVHLYVLYIAVALVAGLAWAVLGSSG